MDGFCQDADIADVFCDSLTRAQFNSYSDCEVDCFDNVKNGTGKCVMKRAICVQLYRERLDLICIVHKRNLDLVNIYFILQIVLLLENVLACFVGLDVLRICVMNMT